jgi:5,10-methenyltetrahydrofolate synthetase
MVLKRVLRSGESIARNVCATPEKTLESGPKSALRATLLARREALGEQAGYAAKHAALAARLLEALEARAARSVGFYWPVAGEFDAREVVTRWLADDTTREAALPVVVRPHAPMVFHAWRAGAPMKEGRYRIPVPAEEHVVVPDLLLIPCVGFDADLYRLGYGGGYYDRTLAAWPGAQRPATIGIAFEAGRCGALPREHHDLPLDAILTEAATG